ncbi:glycosyltransferase family 2 protein, partial [Aureobasidium melanogenum]
MSAFDVDIESVRDDNQHNHDSFDGAQTQRTPSLLVPLFGHFQWNNTDSTVVLPSQELEPAYQEALAGVAEDPDFVEVEIEPKAGSISRRASLFANIFTNKDVDVDPDLRFEPSASEVEIKQGIADAQKERSRRKMIHSRNIAATSLVMINTVCIVLSFGLFSVWYATAPLILLAPLVRSTMVVDLIVSHAYKKVRLLLGPPEEELEVPTMDYATAVSFSNESFEDIQSTLDSLVDQKDVDMHKNLLLISCNDNVWNSESAKSTTRIILENILTNIVDEAKFQMPRDGPDAGFENMWCRRGIYKGLPYILMIKEGMTNRVEFVDLIRNLLHSYNLRKESYHNSVPSAFFAWYEEWAELQDFASFDFLVNVNSETLLDEHCISQLYQQALKNPACAGVSSRVEIDSRSSGWSVGNLFSNSQLMYDQIRQSHQTQIMHKASVSPSACQMLRICEETCGPQVLEEIKKRRPSPMSNMVKQICSSTEEDDMMYGPPEVFALQAVHAVTYARSSTTLSDFLIQRQRIAFSTCATNLAILCNNEIHWFERLSSAADLLAWCLPICFLAIIINFLRSAVLGQNIPVLIVFSAIVALPWAYGIASAMLLAHSWEGRLRHLLGFCILVLTGPIVAIVVVVSTVFNLHLLRREQPKRRRSSAIAAQIQPSAV